MNKQDIIDMLNDELSAIGDELLSTKSGEHNYHIMALIIDYFDTNFYNFSEEDIKAIFKHPNPLQNLLKVFIDNQDLDGLIDETIDLVCDEGTLTDPEDDDDLSVSDINNFPFEDDTDFDDEDDDFDDEDDDFDDGE